MKIGIRGLPKRFPSCGRTPPEALRAGTADTPQAAPPPFPIQSERAPYSPELNPVERVWPYLRERFLSLRVFAGYRAVVDACCTAWNRLVAEPGRLRSLCDQPWIRKVRS